MINLFYFLSGLLGWENKFLHFYDQFKNFFESKQTPGCYAWNVTSGMQRLDLRGNIPSFEVYQYGILHDKGNL